MFIQYQAHIYVELQSHKEPMLAAWLARYNDRQSVPATGMVPVPVSMPASTPGLTAPFVTRERETVQGCLMVQINASNRCSGKKAVKSMPANFARLGS